VTPAAGQGGSIVYVARFNVWIAGPDGSARRQLTTDGTEANGYHDPTQSDDGSIFALRGSRTLIRLDRNGQASAPPVSLNALENGAEGLVVSPDGTRLAYATTGFGTEIDPRFGTPAGAFLYGGTDVATADGQSIAGAAAPLLLFPEWLGDAQLIGSDGIDLYATAGGSGAPQRWLSLTEGCLIDLDCPPDEGPAANVSLPSISRDGTVLAYSYRPYFGPAGRRLATLAAPPPAPPATACLIPGQEQYQDPGSFAADASSFVFDDTTFDPTQLLTTPGKGIYVMAVNLRAADCGAASARLVIEGGLQPEWGPAAP
jgi:hypothetical protein